MEVKDYNISHEELDLNDIQTNNYQEDYGGIFTTKGEEGEEKGEIIIAPQKKWRNFPTACALQTTWVITIPTWFLWNQWRR